MNCLLRDLGARDLAAEHGEIRFISMLHADLIETILAALKEYDFLCGFSCALVKQDSGLFLFVFLAFKVTFFKS